MKILSWVDAAVGYFDLWQSLVGLVALGFVGPAFVWWGLKPMLNASHAQAFLAAGCDHAFVARPPIEACPVKPSRIERQGRTAGSATVFFHSHAEIQVETDLVDAKGLPAWGSLRALTPGTPVMLERFHGNVVRIRYLVNGKPYFVRTDEDPTLPHAVGTSLLIALAGLIATGIWGAIAYQMLGTVRSALSGAPP